MLVSVEAPLLGFYVQSSNLEMQIFKVINEDVRELKAALGLDSSFAAELIEILRAVMLFSSTSQSASVAIRGDTNEEISENVRVIQNATDKTFTCEKNSSGIGVSLAYSKGLTRLAHSLLLEFGGLRIPKEDVFYLIYSLTSAGSER